MKATAAAIRTATPSRCASACLHRAEAGARAAPEVIPEPRAVFNSDGTSTSIAAGETKTITVYIQNAGTTAMRDPILTLKSSGSLLIMAARTTCSTISARAATRLSL